MKRLWLLLLICLLPVQVFAAGLTYVNAVAASGFSTSAEVDAGMAVKHLLSKTLAAADSAAADEQPHGFVADKSSSDEDGNSYSESGEDFSTHAGIGDEPVLTQSLVSLPQTSRLASVLRSDAASQPPFLPLAGRPPRA